MFIDERRKKVTVDSGGPKASSGPTTEASALWRFLRRGSGQARGYCITAAAGIAVVALMGGLTTFYRTDRVASPYPLSPPGARVVLKDVPGTATLGMAAPPADTFSRSPHASAALPNLNVQAGAFLTDLDGRWTGEGTKLSIDARRLRGCLACGESEPARPLIVRDITGPMIVLDIGSDRFVLLRRPNSLAVAGATLAAPIEMWRK